MTSGESSRQKRRYKRKSSKGRKLKPKDIAIVGGFSLLVLFIGFIVAYFGMALMGVMFPANSDYVAPKEGVKIFVETNGFHTDLVVPIKNEETKLNWLDKIGDSTLRAEYNGYQYVAIGWGDDGFYMNSYDGDFPSVTVIFSALFIPTPTLMHLTFYPNKPIKSDNMASLTISADQYRNLVTYIDKSFKKDTDNHYIRKNARGYYKSDYFFHANGSYHLFSTCNDWTNNGLKGIGVKTARKAPFSSGVMWHLQ